MIFVTGSAMLPKVLARSAMIFLAVAQVFLAFAPLAEVKGASTTAHVEEAGTTEHHSHDEASCAACVARTLLTSSELPHTGYSKAEDTQEVRRCTAAGSPASRFPTGLAARAPPLNRA